MSDKNWLPEWFWEDPKTPEPPIRTREFIVNDPFYGVVDEVLVDDLIDGNSGNSRPPPKAKRLQEAADFAADLPSGEGPFKAEWSQKPTEETKAKKAAALKDLQDQKDQKVQQLLAGQS